MFSLTSRLPIWGKWKGGEIGRPPPVFTAVRGEITSHLLNFTVAVLPASRHRESDGVGVGRCWRRVVNLRDTCYTPLYNEMRALPSAIN